MIFAFKYSLIPDKRIDIKRETKQNITIKIELRKYFELDILKAAKNACYVSIQ